MRQGFLVVPFKPNEFTKGESWHTLGRKIKPEKYFLLEVDAIAEAEKNAQENPKVSVAVLKTVCIIESKTPEVMKKSYNDKGELISK